MTQSSEQEVHGKWATLVWIGSGVYLFATVDTASFFSWEAAVYLVVGMFVAALVFGAGANLLRRGMVKILAKVISRPTSGTAAAIMSVALILFTV